MDTPPWRVLWTKQLTKKQKTWNDGFVACKPCGAAVLYDEAGKELGQSRLPKSVKNLANHDEPLKCWEGYLVQGDSECDVSEVPRQDSNTSARSATAVQQQQGLGLRLSTGAGTQLQEPLPQQSRPPPVLPQVAHRRRRSSAGMTATTAGQQAGAPMAQQQSRYHQQQQQRFCPEQAPAAAANPAAVIGGSAPLVNSGEQQLFSSDCVACLALSLLHTSVCELCQGHCSLPKQTSQSVAAPVLKPPPAGVCIHACLAEIAHGQKNAYCSSTAASRG